MTKNYDEPVVVTYASNYSTETESQVNQKTRLKYIVSSELTMDSESLSKKKKPEQFTKENSRCLGRKNNIGSGLR